MSQPREFSVPLLASDERVEVQVGEAYADEVDAADLARAVARALHLEGCGDGAVTVVVTDDQVVQALNRQFLGDDRPTDVLSFGAQESAPGFVVPPEAADYLGDVIIAFPFARRQAAELGREAAEELRLLAVHGLLHLLGYDHAEPEDEASMWARQEVILSHLEQDGRLSS